jgi:hypothetical protein
MNPESITTGRRLAMIVNGAFPLMNHAVWNPGSR